MSDPRLAASAAVCAPTAAGEAAQAGSPEAAGDEVTRGATGLHTARGASSPLGSAPLSAQPPGPLRDVRWTSIAGVRFDAAIRQRPPGSGVISVLSAADELAAYADLDTVLRRAVEVLRDQVGLERAGIYLEDAAAQAMRGTFGTGLSGETTDERRLTYPRGLYEEEAHARALAERGRWMVIDEAPHVAHLHEASVVLGYGWLAMTPIRSHRGAVGILHNDCAFSGAPLDEAKQMRAAIFCSLLGNLIEARRGFGTRGESGAASGAGRPSITPAALATKDSLAGKTIEMLRREPTLTGREIAERLGVSDGHLARVFKNATHVSLVEFRNRVRLERFFAIVDRGGSNLHDACLRAGFGSYAQFHRVFRDLLGATPSEYLTGRARRELDVEAGA